jgi:hypothetical protein
MLQAPACTHAHVRLSECAHVRVRVRVTCSTPFFESWNKLYPHTPTVISSTERYLPHPVARTNRTHRARRIGSVRANRGTVNTKRECPTCASTKVHSHSHSMVVPCEH